MGFFGLKNLQRRMRKGLHSPRECSLIGERRYVYEKILVRVQCGDMTLISLER